ncbi:MAG: hypothetical protein IJV80_04325 [Clostridia bacterium]|nr:hypothetical protein [Clostridia bacterium]
MAGHEGHRQRIIKKLDSGALEEHELLEILLFNAVPRRNTNDLAHRLLAAFGSIKGVFSASIEQLSAVNGIGSGIAAYLVCIGKFYEYYRELPKAEYPEHFELETFIQFVKGAYKNLKQEVLDVYLLDESSSVLLRRRFTLNQKGFVEVSPDDFSKLMIEYSPSGIVVVHNHLYGTSTPSVADDRTTKQVQVACSFHNVLFCDHLIYSPFGVYSYYKDGKMQKISQECSIASILDSISI